MTGCGCHSIEAESQRRTLRIALSLNAIMFVIGTAAGVVAQSSGLIADGLDMLADASAYAIALVAIERSGLFKARAAKLSGIVLLVLGIGVLADAGRRALFGSEPEGVVMMIVATLSLVVNSTVLTLLSRTRKDEVHLRATFLFTRADVVANLGVIVSGLLVSIADWRYADLIAGVLIGLYVAREAIEILSQARKAAAREEDMITLT
jgi:cation diffusion facilitator family transporter